ARKVREEMARRYQESLSRPHPFVSVWPPLTTSAYEEAGLLRAILLKEGAGRSLLDLYSGRERATDYGPVLRLEERRVMPTLELERAMGEAWILRTLQLLYGIGKATETRLKLAGYTTLRDLLVHPRWSWQVQQILEAVDKRDLHALNSLVARWFPLSHPLALALLGFVDPEKIVFLDIETLGLFTEAIILIGLVRPEDGAFRVTHFVVREVAEELPALLALAEELKSAKALVTYNGRAFDVNFIQARLRYYGLTYEVDHPNFDLLPFARRYFRDFLPNCRLETVEKALGVTRTIDIPSALVPEFYMDYLKEKNIGPLVAIIEHNRQDLLSLVLLLRKLWAEMVVRGL
ncbi:MAG: ribonuclease H-like domain-containing protein, partial [Candidatus Bipolaricaulaceae bacterium]